MKKIILLLFFIITHQALVFGQLEITRLNDTFSSKIIKRPWGASLENLSVNILINRFDANIRNIHWAKVTPAHWKANLQMGLQPDYDHFTTNWLGHPLHGSLFYNAARNNGYNYWQSIPFTAAGSLVWEYFGETYYASEIDFFTTTFGGIYLGEMTHRLAKLLKPKIKNPTLRFATTTLLNPMDKINRLFYKDSLDNDNINANPLIKSQLTLGASYPFGRIDNRPFGARGYLNYSLMYGDLFKDEEKPYLPFDFFVFKTWINFSFRGKDSIFFNISSHAPLLVKRIGNNTVFSFSQHYDFLESDVYKIGSLAFTSDYFFQHQWQPNNYIMGSVKAGYILFGSSKSNIMKVLYHSDDPEFLRDYVYGKGYTTEAEVLFKTKKFGKFMGDFNHWVIYTNRDTEGVENIMLLIVDYDYPIWKNVNLGVQANYYKRIASYKNYPNFEHITNDYYELKALVSLTF
jgi:Domain of unknown function (DUF3943)